MNNKVEIEVLKREFIFKQVKHSIVANMKGESSPSAETIDIVKSLLHFNILYFENGIINEEEKQKRDNYAFAFLNAQFNREQVFDKALRNDDMRRMKKSLQYKALERERISKQVNHIIKTNVKDLSSFSSETINKAKERLYLAFLYYENDLIDEEEKQKRENEVFAFLNDPSKR